MLPGNKRSLIRLLTNLRPVYCRTQDRAVETLRMSLGALGQSSDETFEGVDGVMQLLLSHEHIREQVRMLTIDVAPSFC
jgi:hypothetical protein